MNTIQFVKAVEELEKNPIFTGISKHVLRGLAISGITFDNLPEYCMHSLAAILIKFGHAANNNENNERTLEKLAQMLKMDPKIKEGLTKIQDVVIDMFVAAADKEFNRE